MPSNLSDRAKTLGLEPERQSEVVLEDAACSLWNLVAEAPDLLIHLLLRTVVNRSKFERTIAKHHLEENDVERPEIGEQRPVPLHLGSLGILVQPSAWTVPPIQHLARLVEHACAKVSNLGDTFQIPQDVSRLEIPMRDLDIQATMHVLKARKDLMVCCNLCALRQSFLMIVNGIVKAATHQLENQVDKSQASEDTM